MWWLLFVVGLGCGGGDADQASDGDLAEQEPVPVELWAVSLTQDSWFIPAGASQQLVVDAPLTLLGPTIGDTEYRQVVGGALVAELWPELARLEPQRLAEGMESSPDMVARQREPADAPLLDALPEYRKKRAVATARAAAPSTTVVVPIDLKTGTADQRISALESYEDQDSMTGAIAWVMKNDSNYEVRRKAWRVLRARWRRGTGSSSEHESASVWLSTNGDKDMRSEAISAIGSNSASLDNAKRHLGDDDRDIRLRSAQAVADVGGRTNRSSQARQILAAQVSKESDKKVAKQIGKLISEL